MKNIKPGYYSAHAFDFFTKAIKKQDLFPALSDKEIQNLLYFMENLKRCHKYLLPKDNEIGFQVQEYEKYIQFLKLPHESLIMEMPISPETDKPGCIGSSKRIFLLMEILNISEHDKSFGIEDGFHIFWIDFAPEENLWVASPVFISFDRTTKESIISYLFPDLMEKHWEQGDEMDETMQKATTAIFYDVVDFLCALNCKNIGQTIIPEPKELSKTRVKRGKMAMYQYHVLDIHLDAIGRQFDISRTDKRNASQRLHVCRGHFKKRETGIYWWSDHMRGKKELGVIEKDYQIIMPKHEKGD